MAAAIISLFAQILPLPWDTLLLALDVRHWLRSVWLGLNAAIIFGLFAVRFGPALVEDWRQRRERQAAERAKHVAQQAAKAQRETLEQIKAGRRRRTY